MRLITRNPCLSAGISYFRHSDQLIERMHIISQIIQPTLLLDQNKCLTNIQKMIGKCKSLNLDFRPHFKTHQSNTIGKWFSDRGVNKITVSSLRMAEYFANGGWNDITVAFPVNVLEISLVQQLSQKIKLNLLLESIESIQIINSKITNSCGAYIKIDVGTQRTGVEPDNHLLIKALIKKISESKNLRFRGFLAHAGHTYKARKKDEIIEAHSSSIKKISKLKSFYITKHPKLHISYGDTPSSSIANNFHDVNEIRPGNFAFYDLTQVEIGSCHLNQIAVAMACPVVAKHPKRSEIIIYGGGVHFSKDRLQLNNNQVVYGKVVTWEKNGWKSSQYSSYLKSISQEHGVIKAHPSLFSSTKIGEVLPILPVHSCMTADLMKSYLLTDGNQISDFLKYN